LTGPFHIRSLPYQEPGGTHTVNSLTSTIPAATSCWGGRCKQTAFGRPLRQRQLEYDSVEDPPESLNGRSGGLNMRLPSQVHAPKVAIA
jgi:hypothetical protein